MAEKYFKREAVRRTLPRARRLNKAEIQVLRLIKDGADIHDYMVAKLLRRIDTLHPGLISIGQLRMYRGDGTDRMPYFGAILTAKGRKLLKGHGE